MKKKKEIFLKMIRWQCLWLWIGWAKKAKFRIRVDLGMIGPVFLNSWQRICFFCRDGLSLNTRNGIQKIEKESCRIHLFVGFGFVLSRSSQPRVLILDGNLEHGTHAWRKISLFGEINPSFDCHQSNQMPLTDQITVIAPYPRKYHGLSRSEALKKITL